MDWSRLPDLAAVTLLATAFAAVVRRSQASVSALWLTGWAVIALHFGALMFASIAGPIGTFAAFIGLASLTWAGVLFIWASVPHGKTKSGLWMLGTLLSIYSTYIAVLLLEPESGWALIPTACLIGVGPLVVSVFTLKKKYQMRWTLIALNCGLSVFLLAFHRSSESGTNVALNAVFFTVYFGCCIQFMNAYPRRTAGAFITISGFFCWAAVFAIEPELAAQFPNLHIENEAWNLPKYLVAFGMILLILEDQIEHNMYLALHDELTGLPNRRLFQDRLASAVERARRTGTCTALLLLDLDHFKFVNDTLGHHVGDQLLKRVGVVVNDRIRRSDTVARTGGDEFSVILDDPINREHAEQVGRSLIELLAEPFELGDQKLHIEASIGVALYPQDAADCEGLCIAADLRMYDSKNKAEEAVGRFRPPVSATLPALNAEAQPRRAG